MLASPRANARRPNYVHTSILHTWWGVCPDVILFHLCFRDAPRFTCSTRHGAYALLHPPPSFPRAFFGPLAFFTNDRPGALRRLCTCGPFFVDRTDVQAGGAVRPSSADEVQVFGGDYALRAHVAGVHDARECVTGAAQSVREKKQILGVFFFSRNLA